MKFLVKAVEEVKELFKSYGVKNYSRLQKVPVVDKNGHTRMVYKKVGETDIKKNNTGNAQKEFEIRHGLKKTNAIADYIEKKLKELGFEVERKYSRASKSEYIEILNYGEITGKPQESIKIRISDHNLPDHYYDEGLRPFYDIAAEGVNRTGSEDECQNYEEVLTEIISRVPKEKRDEAKEKKEKEKEEKKELNQIDYPEWAADDKLLEKKIDDWKANADNLPIGEYMETIIFLRDLQDKKKRARKERYQKVKQAYNQERNKNPDYWKLYDTIFS